MTLLVHGDQPSLSHLQIDTSAHRQSAITCHNSLYARRARCLVRKLPIWVETHILRNQGGLKRITNKIANNATVTKFIRSSSQSIFVLPTQRFQASLKVMLGQNATMSTEPTLFIIKAS
jgi:hypothetical protein